MSTILRALQKVEKDPTEDPKSKGSTYSLKPSHTISRKMTTLWYLQVGKKFLAVGAGLTVFTVIIIGLIRMVGQDPAGHTESNIHDPQKSFSQTVPIPSENQTAQNGGPSRPKSYSPKPTSDPNHQPGQYYNSQTANALERQATDIRPHNRVEPPLDMETLASGDDEAPYYDDYEEEPPQEYQAFEVLESDPEEVRYAQLDILNDGDLELQAISYAQTPSERMAVINNDIIREGRSINGYKIIYIGPEQVVVEQRGAQWKLIFMKR